jgi:hypothetical protein
MCYPILIKKLRGKKKSDIARPDPIRPENCTKYN